MQDFINWVLLFTCLGLLLNQHYLIRRIRRLEDEVKELKPRVPESGTQEGEQDG